MTNNQNAFSAVLHGLFRLGGADPAGLNRASPDDRMLALRTGLALMLAFLFSAGAASAALAIALPGLAWFWHLGPALIVASIVALYDHAMVQAHWLQAGRLEAVRRGLSRAGRPPGFLAAIGAVFRAGLRGGLAFGLRLALSLVIAIVIGTIAELAFFASDIEAHRERTRQAANAPLLRKLEADYDARLSRLVVQAQAAEGEAAQLAADQRRIAAIIAQEEATFVQQKRSQIAALQQQRQAHLARAAEEQAHADAERFGQARDPRHSGVAGKGQRYEYARARAGDEEASARAIEAEILRLEARTGNDALDRLRRESEALARLAESHRARARDSLDQHARLLAARREAITAELLADPAHVKPTDGLMQRLEVMAELRERPSVYVFAFALKVFFMLVEMGALVAKILIAVPSLYGITTAAEFEAQASTALEATAVALDEAQARAGERHERAEERADLSDRSRRRRTLSRHTRAGYSEILDDVIRRSQRRS